MTYAIVVVEKPAGHLGQIQSAWHAFVSQAADLGTIGGTDKRIAENCWLLQLENDSGLLASVVVLAQDLGIAHRVLYFPEAPLEYWFRQPQ